MKLARRPETKESASFQPQIIYANSYSLNVTTHMHQYSVTFAPELDTKNEKRTRESILFFHTLSKSFVLF